MTQIRCKVYGLPPKKHGEQSMWRLWAEARRLLALRKAAHEVMAGCPPLRENIRLRLVVHVGAVNDRSIGDVPDGLLTMQTDIRLAQKNNGSDPICTP